MATIIIKTQSELDALPASFEEYTYIEIHSTDRVSVTIHRENSSVVARGNSSVVAWENSSVVARENSSVEARENSSVVARENSSVVAWGNSSVEARGNSSVEARGNSCARLFSTSSTVRLHGYAVGFANVPGTIEKVSDKATVITPERYRDNYGWLEENAVSEDEAKCVVLFKRVSKEFKTQEGEPWETIWAIGSNLIHPSWNPSTSECSGGKYHACSRPCFCDEFRSVEGDRYIAIRIESKNLHAWVDNPQYPHKIAFRAGLVLYEVDRMGRKIEGRT